MAGPDAPPALAVTMGEPAGIGIEITLAAWRDRRQAGLPPFFVLGCPDMIARRAGEIGIEVPIAPTTPEDVHAVFDSALPVVPIEAAVRGIAGVPDPDDARAVIGSIERAVEFCHQGRASAVVTNPIQKKSLYDAGFSYPGHTEFLGVLAEKWGPGPWRPVMMLAGPELRTVPVTGHIALGKVPARLTSDRIVAFGRITARELEHRFGITNPRLAVAGLNPHAGEGGAMGDEDAAIIAPAVATLVAEGIAARGPLPADTLFHAAARTSYDAVLAMYHDQALIPVKTIAFDETVNVTLGLPFVRTSPDHGTALDIAGRGIARPTSLVHALRMAGEMARRNRG